MLDTSVDQLAAEYIAMARQNNWRLFEICYTYHKRTQPSNWPDKVLLTRSTTANWLSTQLDALLIADDPCTHTNKHTPQAMQIIEQWAELEPRKAMIGAKLDYRMHFKLPKQCTSIYYPNSHNIASQRRYLAHMIDAMPANWLAPLYTPSWLDRQYEVGFACMQLDEERKALLTKYAPDVSIIGSPETAGILSGTELIAAQLEVQTTVLHLPECLTKANPGVSYITPRIAEAFAFKQLLLIPDRYKGLYADMFPEHMFIAPGQLADMQLEQKLVLIRRQEQFLLRLMEETGYVTINA